MRKLLLGIAVALAVEGSALACVCAPPDDREVARHIASNAVAVADVVQVEDASSEAELPELYRVLRVHVGRAPDTFWLAREFMRWPGGRISFTLSTTCDASPRAGERRIVVLYEPSADQWQPEDCRRSSNVSVSADRTLAIGGTCDDLFLQKEGALELIREEARKLRRPVGR